MAGGGQASTQVVEPRGDFLPSTRRTPARTPRSSRWLRVLVIVVLLWFFLVPVARLVWLSFSTESGWGLANYGHVLAKDATWVAVKNTLYVSLVSTALAVVLGVAAAWLIAYTDVRGKRAMQPLMVLPFILPPYVVTLAWAESFDTGGVGGRFLALLGTQAEVNFYSLNGISFVLGLIHYPIVYLLTVGVLQRIPREMEQAARAHGAGRLTALRKVTLVAALPGIAGGALLAFLTALDNFGVPAFLGIPAGITVLSTEIYQQIVGFGPSAFYRAAALSVLLGAIAVLGTVVQMLVVRRSRASELSHVDRTPRVHLRLARPFVEIATWCVLVGTLAVPVASIVLSSLSTALGVEVTLQTATLDNFRELVLDSDDMRGAMLTSGKLGISAMVICIIVGTLIAYLRVRRPSVFTKVLDSAVALPYALPGIVMALAIIFAWVEPLPGWYPGIYGTWVIILVGYVTRFTFYQVRSSAASLAQLDPAVEEAARASGAGPVTVWRRIIVPLIAAGIAAGAVLVLLKAMSELTVSSILYSAGAKTVGVVIFSFQQAGYANLATAASTLVLVAYAVVGLALLVARALWRRRVRSR
ncbi:MAG: ABC transporter permease [Streptosporangiales bacterium]